MKNLRLIKFSPALGVATRYWEEDGFRSDDILILSELTTGQQAVVTGAVAWATAQLPDGYSVLESIELEKIADVPTAWSTGDAPEPTAYSAAFVASIVGNGEKGQSATEINSVPGDVTNAMAGLWAQLATP